MGIWNVSGSVSVANLERVHYSDIICGTEAQTTDLNALLTAGHKRILLAPGAILTADVTISASDGYIRSLLLFSTLNLGAYQLTFSGVRWILEGFEVSGATKTGIILTSASADFILIGVSSRSHTGASSHGIDLQTTNNDFRMTGCSFRQNGGDGVKLGASASAARIVDNFIWGNTGYGVNDGSDSSIIVANRLNNNTAGAINGTPAIDVGNLKT